MSAHISYPCTCGGRMVKHCSKSACVWMRCRECQSNVRKDTLKRWLSGTGPMPPTSPPGPIRMGP